MAHLPLYQGLLAEIEAETGISGALSRVDQSLELARQTGEHLSDSLLYRVRGEILRKLDPTKASGAEDAFRAAVAIAQQQGARSFELQSALALARFYRSTARPVEAYAAVAPALEGFSPTPEMPEIAEAQALLTALAETEEIKAAVAQRR